jgi:hypothetical protein
MTVKEIYTTANNFARRFDSPWKDDAIQDTVISTWQIASSGHTPAYLRSHIMYKLQSAIQYYNRRVGDPYNDTLTVEDYFLSLPLKGNERVVAEKMIEANFQLDFVALSLGKSQSVVSRIWRNAKKKLREVYA